MLRLHVCISKQSDVRTFFFPNLHSFLFILFMVEYRHMVVMILLLEKDD